MRAQAEELEGAHHSLRDAQRTIEQLTEERVHLRESAEEEAAAVREQLEEQKTKVKRMWRMNCEQITMYHDECCNKDYEIATLRTRIAELEATSATVHSAERVTTSPRPVAARDVVPRTSPRPVTVVPVAVVPDRPVAARFIGDTVSGDRRGKAPPCGFVLCREPRRAVRGLAANTEEGFRME